MTTRNDLELRIEGLVLHGFAPGDRRRIAAAVERELARLFAERGLPPSLTREGEIESLDGLTFEASSGAEKVGESVARTLYKGLGR